MIGIRVMGYGLIKISKLWRNDVYWYEYVLKIGKYIFFLFLNE